MSKEKGTFDPEVEREMEERIENFQKAMKDPTKRLTPDPNVKHDVHNVDTQGFSPNAKITVDDESNESSVVHEVPAALTEWHQMRDKHGMDEGNAKD